MCWIEDLKDKEGKKVRLVGMGDGHEHWGFVLGEVYEIKRDSWGNMSFFGRFSYGDLCNNPFCNWPGWKFVRATPRKLENK